jgi:hypothetical protein
VPRNAESVHILHALRGDSTFFLIARLASKWLPTMTTTLTVMKNRVSMFCWGAARRGPIECAAISRKAGGYQAVSGRLGFKRKRARLGGFGGYDQKSVIDDR